MTLLFNVMAELMSCNAGVKHFNIYKLCKQHEISVGKLVKAVEDKQNGSSED